jgi:phage FluMu protein Com
VKVHTLVVYRYLQSSCSYCKQVNIIHIIVLEDRTFLTRSARAATQLRLHISSAPQERAWDRTSGPLEVGSHRCGT